MRMVLGGFTVFNDRGWGVRASVGEKDASRIFGFRSTMRAHRDAFLKKRSRIAVTSQTQIGFNYYQLQNEREQSQNAKPPIMFPSCRHGISETCRTLWEEVFHLRWKSAVDELIQASFAVKRAANSINQQS